MNALLKPAMMISDRAQRPAVVLVAEVELARHRGVRHQPVVGVDRHAQAVVDVEVDRMRLPAGGRAGLHVRRRTDLECDPVIVDVVQEVAALDEPRAVTDPVRAALVDRLVHRIGAERFARVCGAVDVVVDHELERVPMELGRVVDLGAREIEADDAAVLERDAELRDPQR
jgi:hypothetical protein